MSSALVVGAFSLSAFAQELPNEGPVATTALITAQSKNNVPFNTAALKLEVNGHAAAIASITPVQTAGAQVAILIDDGLRGSFDVQIRDVKDFVRNLPSGTQVFVGYMQNGTVRNEGGFTTDHAAVADSLRIPLTEPGI
ncbi:MAG: hypothetical protein ACRYFU_15195, partial [Janthinobacterium lividum]